MRVRQQAVFKTSGYVPGEVLQTVCDQGKKGEIE